MTLPLPLLPVPLVSVNWLAANLGRPSLVVLDASLGTPASVRIPGARVFDFDRVICDQANPLPHMMPSPEVFAREVGALGIDNSPAIVVYDAKGIYSSPRARWMFRAMGHDAVAVLEGGLPAWTTAGHPVESKGESPVAPRTFVPRPRAGLFCDADTVAEALKAPGCVVIDARSTGRFHGREPEPRPGLRPGHMPNARNLPFTEVLDAGRFRPKDELEKLVSARAQPTQRLIFSCGSGVTACISALAAELAGFTDIAIYDGSWSEWGIPSNRPVVTE